MPSFKKFGAKEHGVIEMEKRNQEVSDQRVKAAPSDVSVGGKVLLKREKYMHELLSRWQNEIFCECEQVW